LSGPFRVAVLTDHFSPQSSGGVEHVVWEVYRRLAAEGVEVLVLTALERGKSPFAGLETRSVRIWDLSRVVGAQFGVAPALFHAVSRAIEAFHPDVLHANGLHFQTTLAATLANRRRTLPMVLTSHVAGLDALQQPTRALTHAYESSFGRHILRRCSRVISIAPSVRKHLLELGVDPNLIDDVPNGVDHQRFHAADAPRPPGPPLLMFIGRHMPNKGPQVFIEALGRLRDEGVAYRAELLSSGPMRERLERRTQALNLRERVTFRGHVADVADEMRRADIIVRPSFSEGMPLSLLEAMATRVSLVVSDVPGNNDLIRDGENGLLFAPGRLDELVAKMKRLIDSPELRASLADVAWKDAQQYTWDRTAAGTIESLRKAAAQPEVRQPVMA
jgi:glycosyltransferase involved in cell wall biosynthesis